MQQHMQKRKQSNPKNTGVSEVKVRFKVKKKRDKNERKMDAILGI